MRNADYLVGLTVGFLRSHITVLDLAEQSEVADAATLLRKNIEAVARIRELENAKNPGLLFKRTPNLNALRGNAAKLYGDYSEIAHSSHPRVSELLGSAEDARPGWVSMHPKFSEHTLVLITNAFVVYAEFYHWARGTALLISADFPLQKVDSWTAQLHGWHDAVSVEIDRARERP
ncbi:hypothetical protein [Cryobacterium sp. TMT2-23]|uniref:hypothetical protein n=1 Tax=Cryobacterium sp. TMT2-23 TaxID=1259252 RepID=UPI00141BCA00|nr:hypothetical protein [Cryobacterium sp. TMT2-23]